MSLPSGNSFTGCLRCLGNLYSAGFPAKLAPMITLYGLGVVDIIRRQGDTRILATCLAIVAVLDSDSWKRDMMAAQRKDERKSEKTKMLPYLPSSK